MDKEYVMHIAQTRLVRVFLFWKWQEHVMFPVLRSISVFRSLLI